MDRLTSNETHEVAWESKGSRSEAEEDLSCTQAKRSRAQASALGPDAMSCEDRARSALARLTWFSMVQAPRQ